MAVPAGVETVSERRVPGDVPLWSHAGWEARFPWLVQGTTGRGDGDEPFDLGLAGAQPVGPALDRWRALIAVAGMESAAHARQVHGADLCIHREVGAPGVLVMDGFDGHLTARPGVLLSVGVADCVPVSIVCPEGRAVALVHSGWRGTAAGIVEHAVRRLVESGRSAPERLWLHCGPAICGVCYEVGPEVHAAVNPHLDAPATNTPIDVRASIARRGVEAGISPDRITLSAHCTRCGPGGFFSHRAGSKARQVGVLGIRPG